MRISDADRQRVVDELDQHLSAGRVGLDEYSLRIEEVMGAETLADLDHATRDLPFMRVLPAGGQGRGRRSAGALQSGGTVGGLPGGVTGAAFGLWRARLVLLLAALFVVVGVLLAVSAQVAYIAILLVGWLLGIALGRASHARR